MGVITAIGPDVTSGKNFCDAARVEPSGSQKKRHDNSKRKILGMARVQPSFGVVTPVSDWVSGGRQKTKRKKDPASSEPPGTESLEPSLKAAPKSCLSFFGQRPHSFQLWGEQRVYKVHEDCNTREAKTAIRKVPFTSH